MDSKKMIAGLLAGTAIGVAIGILMAPSSGERTRAKLMLGTRRVTDNLQETLEDSIDSLKDRFKSGVDKAVKTKEMINQASEHAKA